MVRRILVVIASGLAGLAVAALLWRSLAPESALVRVVAGERLFQQEFRSRNARFDAEHPPEFFRTFPDSRFPRERFGLEAARRVLPQLRTDASIVHEPREIVRRKAGIAYWAHFAEHPDRRLLFKTNERGWREDEPFDAGPLDLRILVAGDSHSEGACRNDESWANLLERLLADRTGARVRVDNASCAGHTLHNHLGVLEAFLDPVHGVPPPDVFAIALYAGNDLVEALQLHYQITRTARPPEAYAHAEQVERIAEVGGAAVPQLWYQLLYLRQNPLDQALALDVLAAGLDDVRRSCALHGIRFVPLWLPAAADVEWDRHPALARAADLVRVSEDDRRMGERLKRGLFERTAELDWIDLSPWLTDVPEGAFWRSDQHLSVAGQRRVAEAVLARLDQAGVVAATAARVSAADPSLAGR